MNLKPTPSKPFALLILFFMLAGTGLCLEGTEYQIKGAMMMNFIKFVEWPESSAEPDGNRITIGIVGKNNFGGTIDAVAGRVIAGKQIAVRYIGSLSQIHGCRVLFIGASESHRYPQILRQVSGSPVLTIGEDPDFTKNGGIIRFYSEKDHIRFEINQTAAINSHLKLSAKLLEIAGTIY